MPTIDSRARCFELLVGPVVDGDADDRAVEEAAGLEPVERAKRHHLRQVAGDPEDDEDVGRLGLLAARRGRCPLRAQRCRLRVPSPTSRDRWLDPRTRRAGLSSKRDDLREPLARCMKVIAVWALDFKTRQYLKGSLWFLPLLGGVTGAFLGLLEPVLARHITMPGLWSTPRRRPASCSRRSSARPPR